MTKFWITRILGIILVIVVAALVLIFSPDPTKSSPYPSEPKKEKRDIAENVSKFYEAFKHSSTKPHEEKYGEFVIPLDKQVTDVASAIDDITDRIYPPMDNWQGPIKERPFKKEGTLKQEAETFAQSEGFHLVWDLKHDYVILDRFVSTNTLVGMLDDIAVAIDANYQRPVLVYYCFKKRALVLTERESDYFTRNCQKSYASMYKN